MRLPTNLTSGAISTPAHQTKTIQSLRSKINVIGANAGTGTLSFQSRREEILSETIINSDIRPADLITSPLDVRVYANLLSTSSDFVSFLDINDDLFNAIEAITPHLSTIALTQLIRSYFMYFDTIGDGEAIKSYGQFITKHLNTLANSKYCGRDIKVFSQYSSLLFSVNGPRQIALHSQKTGVPLQTILTAYHLTPYAGGRYLKVLYYFYYLAVIQNIDPDADHPILKEILKPEVLKARFKTGLLGNEILRILLDRTTGSKISNPWKRTILAIAGDPRVGKTNSNYQTWWAPIGQARVHKFSASLSANDVRLFLEVLYNSTLESKDSDLIASFAQRKRFIESLISRGLVVNSRLFFGTIADSYVKRHVKPEDRQLYADVKSLRTSAIYLNLQDRIHLVEGTHQFKLSMYDKLPPDSQLLNMNQLAFEDRDLRTGIKESYEKHFRSRSGYIQLTHRGDNWITRANDFINNKLNTTEVK
jgi:hypothetical protein